MKNLFRTVALLALAGSGLTAANAQETAYPDPALGDGGALIVSIWDPNANVSIVYAINDLLYQDIANGALGAGGSFDLAVPQFASVFGGSNIADIRFTVTAAGVAPNGTGALFATGPAVLPFVANGSVAGTFQNAQVFASQLTDNCGLQNPCIALSNDVGQYAGGVTWGDLSAQLPYSAAGGINESLSFYSLTQSGSGRIRPSDPAEIASVATGASWLLDASGLLSYSVVPIPAAAWLLLSGLLGFGAIARRRQAAVA